jgi:eukaryotic-like serine/threonine-protein kinase
MTAAADRLSAVLSDRYRIERELGAGGMATVYLAHDLKHDRKVAIKVLKPELAAVLGAERFVTEIKTTAALQHPNILPLFDSGEASGFLFYVMPYVEGETLRTKLDRETQLSVEESVQLVREVADALQYAHEHGVVHRDIKPENILLHAGRPMVADFGIALAVSAAAGGRMTETGLSLGTPHYMSPEQATAEKNITARSDIYSLASVLYEMLAGQPPHLGGSAQQIIMKIVTEPVEPVTRYRKSVPPNVVAAVAKSLEKLPADRFESAKAFAEALGNASFTTMHAAGVGGGAATVEGRNRWLAGALGVLLLAAGVGIGALLNRHQPPVPQVVRFIAAPGSGEQLFTSRLVEETFALSPDGSRLAYVAADSGAAARTLHVRSLDQFRTTSFPGTEGAVSVFWSPDGLWIGVVTVGRTILKVSASGGPVSQLVSSVDRDDGAPSWGDDHFIVYTNGGVPMRVGDGGGAATPLVDTMKAKVLSVAPTLLPGSHALLLSVCHGPESQGCARDLGALDLATGKVKVLVAGANRGWYLPQGLLVYGTAEGALFAVKFDLKSLTVTSAPVGVLDGIETGTQFALAKVAISASGIAAYLPARAQQGAVIVQRDRTGREEVVVSKPEAYAGPRLSPDGRRLLFFGPDAKGVDQLWIYDRVSLTTRQLTFDGVSVRPTWSPDGNRVAFSGQRNSVWHTLWMPADGSSPAERVSKGRDVVGSSAVSWTRDGKWIVVDGPPSDGKGAGGEDVFAIPTTDTSRAMRPAAASPFNDQSGEVSPDGKWIAYNSDDAGQYQVYIQPFLAPGGRTLISTGRAEEPAWLSNNELVYLNRESDSLTLAHLEFGRTIEVTRTPLFSFQNYESGSVSARYYDVSRDGKYFILVKRLATKESVAPVVVLNWTTEVQRLMAAAGIK